MAEKKATLACIVNTYNRAEYIEQCLNSILMQETEYDVTVIIVDDCSNDNTKNIVENFIERNSDKKIYFFSTKENTGLGKKALQNLKSQLEPYLKTDYFYRIDSDDYITDNKKFEKQISYLEQHPECVGICHHYKILDEETKEETISDQAAVGVYSVKDMLKMYCQKAFYNHTSTYMFRNVHKSALPPEFEKESVIGDVLFNWAMMRHGKVCFTDDVMTTYRLHKGGVWNALSEKEKKRRNRILLLRLFAMLKLENKLYFIFHIMKISMKKIIKTFLRSLFKSN